MGHNDVFANENVASVKAAVRDFLTTNNLIRDRAPGEHPIKLCDFQDTISASVALPTAVDVISGWNRLDKQEHLVSAFGESVCL